MSWSCVRLACLVTLAALGPIADARAAPVADPSALDPAVEMRLEGVTAGTPASDGFRPMRFEPQRRTGTAAAPAPGPSSPTLTVAPRAGSWDWSSARALKVHVHNAMPWAVTLRFAIRDLDGSQLAGAVGLPPGPAQTLAIPLRATQPREWGMLAGPPMPWTRSGERIYVATSVEGQLMTGKVASVSFEIPRPDSPQTLRVGKLYTETQRDDVHDAYEGIVDAFGQFTRADWPGKVGHEDQLRAAGANEDRLLVNGRPATRDQFPRDRPTRDRPIDDRLAPERYGGLQAAEGRRLPVTGFFQVQKVSQPGGPDRWWLVTPDGQRFYSLGVNAVRMTGDQTIVEGREFMYTALPPAGDRLERFYGRHDSHSVLGADAGAQRGRGFATGRTYDFYRANLMRRDGDAWEARWLERTPGRLRDWGFNTIGNWSEPVLTLRARIPYVASLHTDGEYSRLSGGQDWWGRAPDPFDPRFAQALKQAVEHARPQRHDAFLIGWFVDNEIAWGDGNARDPRARYAIAYSALRGDARDPNAHAKRAFIEQLRQKYGQVEAFANAWGLAIVDWNELDAPMVAAPAPDRQRPAIAEDLSAFLALHADSYFRQVAQALKAVDPNHLYLGVRFSSRTPEALAACARWCDVVSFNLYVPTLAGAFDAAGFHALNKPALVSEFHFGSRDRGPFWGGVQEVANEAERGPAYARMLASVVGNPDFVGAHWFQWLDEPVTGRWLDGENGHLGLVGITDLPWTPFVDQVREANLEAMRRLQREAIGGDAMRALRQDGGSGAREDAARNDRSR